MTLRAEDVGFMPKSRRALESPQGRSRTISGPEPAHDPAAWQEDFHRWAIEKCIYRPDGDDSGGVKALWNDFAEWAVAHDTVPCLRSTFEQLLTDAGFQLKDGMVLGLVLREDVESLRDSEPRLPEHGAPTEVNAPRSHRTSSDNEEHRASL